MRILHLVSYHLYSGPVAPTVGLALAQRALGHTVWMAVDGKRGHLPDAFEEPAAPSLARAALAPSVSLALSTHSTPLEYIHDITRLRAFIRSSRADVLHVHQSHDHGLSLWLGRDATTRIRTVHAPRALRRRLGERWMFRHTGGVILRCQEHLDAFAAQHTPPIPAVVIPGSVDAARFDACVPERGAEARARWGIPQAVPLVGMAALLAGRGQAELLEAAATQPQVHVLLAGRGSEEAALRDLCARSKLSARTHFVGYLAGDALLDAYAACDAMLIARPGNDAGARAALEAMAAGVPVMAVAREALAELVTPARGLCAPHATPDHIAAMLHGFLADRPKAAARAAAARRYVLAHRGFAGEGRATLAFYEEAARRSRHLPT